MAETLILPAFRFEVKLIRSPSIIAGSQQLPGASQGYTPPAGDTVLGGRTSADWRGAFQECAGLEIEMDIQEYQEGGRNNGTIRRVGRAKFQPIVLKRGMFYLSEGEARVNTELWHWIQRIINGERPVPRHDGVIYVMSADGTVRASWMFDRGLPAKIRGPELNAKTGEIAIEELSIAHEGLRLLPAEEPLT
uniref:phage tail protein n=1 Tax=Cupriavidus yeoncheonensis TaxID=1462994 RepID=UPI003F49AE2B